MSITSSSPVPARRRSPWSVALLALATFLVVLTLLVVQMRAGLDPALGGSAWSASRQAGHGALRTHASGTAAARGPTGHAGHGVPVTRVSGGAAAPAGGFEDD